MPRFRSSLDIGVQLGAGHFGAVHRGIDPVHGDVAVKILAQKVGESDAEWNARKAALLREAQRLKDATHANVVRVWNLVESEQRDNVNLVMELCQGSLDVNYRNGPMKLSEIRRVITDVALGLQALHTREMIHRDIKPANILLDGNGRAKLGDFGLVTNDIVLGYASQQGYADHVAIEVWQGQGTSVKTDIWALGMTVYRLLHGHSWYQNMLSPRVEVRNGDFAVKLKWLPHVPREWRRFLRKMMHDDPAQRYQSVTQVLNGIASLSVLPEWVCSYSAAGIVWSRSARSRCFVVELERNGRLCKWHAVSSPIGRGRNRTIGTSGGWVAESAAERTLTSWFARHR